MQNAGRVLESGVAKRTEAEKHEIHRCECKDILCMWWTSPSLVADCCSCDGLGIKTKPFCMRR